MTHGHIVVGFIFVFFVSFFAARKIATKLLISKNRNLRGGWKPVRDSADKISLAVASVAAMAFVALVSMI